MSAVDNLLENPLDAIRGIFDECHNKNVWLNQLDEHFKSLFKDEKNLNSVHLLSKYSLNKLNNGDIVRFQGMIQDMLEPEFFKETYEVMRADGETQLRPGVFFEELDGEEAVNLDSPNCQTGQRQVFCITTIPGEMNWVKEDLYGQDYKYFSDQKKRENESIEEVKNNLDDLANVDNKEKDDVYDIFPWNELSLMPNNVSCILKTHKDYNFMLNDVIEIVGILYKDGIHTEIDLDENIKYMKHVVLYSIFIKKVNHYNPSLPREIDFSSYSLEWMREAREKFRSILEVALLGDGLASEFLLLHFISSVYHRHDMIPLGNFSLNLTGINETLQKDGYTGFLSTLFGSLISHMNYFPMTIKNINNLSFIPKKNYDINRMSSGILQLPAHTHFIVDETKLAAGNLKSSGIKNISAIGNIVNWQKHDLDFKFYNLEQHTNVPTLILSEGKSIINCEQKLELKPVNTINNSVSSISSTVKKLVNENAKMIREYLTIARLLPFTLEEHMSKTIEDYFVASRKKSSKVSAIDLHKLLVIGRLVSVSCGENKMTIDTWKSAKILAEESFLRNNV